VPSPHRTRVSNTGSRTNRQRCLVRRSRSEPGWAAGGRNSAEPGGTEGLTNLEVSGRFGAISWDANPLEVRFHGRGHRALVRLFSTVSRPALRAAASGGRPRPATADPEGRLGRAPWRNRRAMFPHLPSSVSMLIAVKFLPSVLSLCQPTCDEYSHDRDCAGCNNSCTSCGGVMIDEILCQHS
jgi:hypothetical protein